jgi:putative sterol carrier protein
MKKEDYLTGFHELTFSYSGQWGSTEERSRHMSEKVEAIIGSIKKRFNAESAKDVDAVFQLDISGDQAGQWYLTVRDQSCDIAEGAHDRPNVTFSMAGADFVEMMTGKITGQAAFFSGKLRVSGDLMLAQRFEALFSGSSQSR